MKTHASTPADLPDNGAPGRTSELWRGLLSGRWSLIDSFDTGGRRYLVVRESDSDPTPRTALTERHRIALTLRARGDSIKCIAFELGISQPSVCTHLRHAMAHIGIKSDLELTRLFGVANPTKITVRSSDLRAR